MSDLVVKLDTFTALLYSVVRVLLSPIRRRFPTPFPYFKFFVVTSVINFIWRMYLSSRQFFRLKRPDVPDVCLKLMTAAEYKVAQAYNREKLVFSMFCMIVNLSVDFGMVIILPWVWKVAAYVMSFQGWVYGELWRSLMFLYLQILFMLPLKTAFALFKDFVIEAKYGYNKKTVGLFVKDLIKVQLLLVAIGAPVGYGFLKLLEYERVVLYASMFYICLSFLLISLFPHVIWPLFNKFTKIDKEGVTENVEALCKEVKYPLKKLYQMDGSKRSGHANAMLFGIWKNKQIVFYDTIIEMLDIQEITAVLAHELGHWHYSHTFRGFFISTFQFVGIVAGFDVVFHDKVMYQAFGFDKAVAGVGLILYSKLLTPMDAALTYIFNAIVRSWEYHADRYAVKLNHGEKLASALQKLAKDEKSNLDPDPMYANYHYSHTPTLIRLKEIQRQLALADVPSKKDK